MNSLDRIKTLSGQNSNQNTINQLNSDMKSLSEQFDAALEALKNGKQIDEGFFSSLKAAFQTASKFGKDGASAVKDKVKAASAEVKLTYQDKKAKAELKAMMNKMKNVIDELDALVAAAPTLLKADKQLAKEMDYFRRVMLKMIATIASRKSLNENITEIDDISDMLFEEGLFEAAPNMPYAKSRKIPSEEMKLILDSDEYKEVAKKMKDVTTNRQLKTGTFMFDTGIAADYRGYGEESYGNYVLKIYADGQIRGEIRGGRNFSARGIAHYRLGKPIKSETPVEMYKEAFKEMVRRYEEKVSKLGKTDEDAFKSFMKKLGVEAFGSDAKIEDAPDE